MQQLTYPIRYGLPGGENRKSIFVACEGGLDLTQDIVEDRPGCNSTQINFEAALSGGYRRIDGYIKASPTPVPGQGNIKGIAVYYPGQIIAARRTAADPTFYDLYYLAGLNTWSKISPSPLPYKLHSILNSHQYNWNGIYKIVFTDGYNPAYTWDTINFTFLNGAGAPPDPRFAMTFHGYMFLSGYSSNTGAVTISAPLEEGNYNPIDGAVELVIGDTVTWLAIWRDQLIVFCKGSIFKIVGNSTDPASANPFTVQPVTYKTGCIEGRTVQEIDGDLVYLAQDGIRTIAGTFNIGDTEIGSISRAIQPIVSNVVSNGENLHSLVVHKKTQYRLFYNFETNQQNLPLGVIGSVRRFRNGSEGWEWGELFNIDPACCTSGYLSNNLEYVLHGGKDGFVYAQELGNTFDGVDIGEQLTTVPLECGDYGIRKAFQKTQVLASIEGGTNVDYIELTPIYDFNKQTTIQPGSYLLHSDTSVVYDQGFKYDRGFRYDTSTSPLFFQNIQGSGFIIQLNISTPIDAILGGNHPSYTIQGFYVDFYPAGRR